MKIIAITGMPLAGKGVVTKKLEERGCKFFLMRTAVEEKMKEQSIEISNESLRTFPTKLREEQGRGVVAELCIPHLDKLKTEAVVVIDGIRSPEEIDVFKKQYGEDFVLIAVWASLKTRFSRLGNRSDHPADEPKTMEELKWRDEKELGWGLGESIARADYMVINEGTMEEYENQIQLILEKLFKRPS